jgi:hypothetical protein
MTLKELYNKNHYSTDKESTHQYLDTYDRLFAPFQDKVIGVFEVGYSFGGSVELWEDYFTDAAIYCIDIKFDKIQWHCGRVYLMQADINELTFSDVYNINHIDIAIDDGSHFVKDQIAFIKLMYQVVRKRGLIIVEDIHDLENNKKYFDELNIPYEIIDLRKQTGVHDSVLLIIRK